MEAENLLTWTLLMSWFLQDLVRKKKCVFAVMSEGVRLLTIGCRTTCVRKNVVGGGTARTQRAGDTDADVTVVLPAGSQVLRRVLRGTL